MKKQPVLIEEDVKNQSTTIEEGLAKLVDGMIEVKDTHLLTEYPNPATVSLTTALYTYAKIFNLPELETLLNKFNKGMISFQRKSRKEMTELAKGIKEEGSSSSMLGRMKGWLGR